MTRLPIIVQMKPREFKARLIAYYLPQFHPILENDKWWGKGFTEWSNVVKAKPFFKGQYQPRLPADLGFYDLRVPEVRAQQADLARQYGVEGFCYWHYWFHGRRLLERPFNEVLVSGEPDFPFCLAWANENWNRRWDGRETQLLVKQLYSPKDDLEHARWLAVAFSDPRYIRVEGRPLFGIFRPHGLPDARQTTDVIRSECTRLGLPEPYIFGCDRHHAGFDMRKLGFDITEHSGPQFGAVPGCFADGWTLATVKRNLSYGLLSRWKRIYDYQYVLRQMAKIRPSHPHFPTFFVGWDNTPRLGPLAVVVTGSEPNVVENELRRYVESVVAKPEEQRVVFINAWNEWAEGMYLEPDQKYGHAMLEAMMNAVRPVS